jgi:hypothetical protein
MLLFLEKIFVRSKMKEDQVWFDEQETYLRNMERQCDVYYQHHTKDFVYYHSLASRFNLPILIVSAIGITSWMQAARIVRGDSPKASAICDCVRPSALRADLKSVGVMR